MINSKNLVKSQSCHADKLIAKLFLMMTNWKFVKSQRDHSTDKPFAGHMCSAMGVFSIAVINRIFV